MAKRTKYAARNGSPLTDEQAEIVGREMEAMQREGLPVTPANLLARCRARKHPLHKLFEWDDAVAAAAWRVEQARRAIAAVVIVEEPGVYRARAAYSVVISEPKPSHREYVSRSVVEADTAMLAQVSADLYGRIVSAVREARSLGLMVQREWQRIDAAVASNEPAAVTLKGSAKRGEARA